MLESLIIGIISSFTASSLFISALYLIRPRIEISPYIAVSINSDGKKTYKIKIVNRRNRKVINIRAELHLIRIYNKPDGKGTDAIKIELKRNEVLCLAPYNKANDALAFEFRFITYEDLNEFWEDINGKHIRFQISATDSFSNFTKVFTKLYHKKSYSIKEGTHLSGGSLDVG